MGFSNAVVARVVPILLTFAIVGCEMFVSSEDNEAPPTGTPTVSREVTDLSVRAGTETLVLTWTDPTEPELSAIRVDCTDPYGRTETVSALPGVEFASLAGLYQNTAYDLTITAEYAFGDTSRVLTERITTAVEYSLQASWRSMESDAIEPLFLRDSSPAPITAPSVGASNAGISTGVEAAVRTASDDYADSIIVKYRNDATVTRATTDRMSSLGAVTATPQTAGARSGPRFARVVPTGVMAATVPGDAGTDIDIVIAQTIAELEALPEVEYAIREKVYRALGTVDDEFYASQWNCTQLGMPAVWDVATGEGVTVAVLDSGVLPDPTLATMQDFGSTNFVAGWDIFNDDAQPWDDLGHGTHVAGTIAQSTNNGVGVAGIAYNATIMPVKVLGVGGWAYTQQIADGIIWATDNGADVINMSLGGGGDQALEDACAYAYESGVVVVAASGNDNGAVGYPAAYDDYVLAVGATGFNGARAPYSNFGNQLDVVAPGGNLQWDYDGDGVGDGILQESFYRVLNADDQIEYLVDYISWQGTSMATPHVAAFAALILEVHPTYSPDQVFETIMENTIDLGISGVDDYYGYGLISPLKFIGYQAGGRLDSLHVIGDRTDTWSVRVDSGTMEITLSFQHPDTSLEMTLRNPSGAQVARSTGTAGVETISYDPGSNTGEYTVEVRFAP